MFGVASARAWAAVVAETPWARTGEPPITDTNGSNANTTPASTRRAGRGRNDRAEAGRVTSTVGYRPAESGTLSDFRGFFDPEPESRGSIGEKSGDWRGKVVDEGGFWGA